MSGDQTRVLLQQWHGGDREALGELIDRNIGWIRGRVAKRMGALLEARGSATDYVQDAMVEVLRYGPKFVMSDEAQFRALMAKIIENVLRGRHDWFTAQRRASDRENALPTGTVVDIDPAGRVVSRPSQVVAQQEALELARLGVSLLDEEDREIIVLRQWDDLQFSEIAEKLGIKEDTARMRFQRALPKLAAKVSLLRSGDIAKLLEH
ncbi:MAG: sigma-70 family RNA polymerase sigma factor [Planctomycetes bacterium]|nr:sigma-70 family RNA polymerase sigma factor [Planctomycetota bacterium]